MQAPFHIVALGATLVTTEVVDLAHLDVMGLTFCVNFLVIDLEKLDIIFGMNWLNINHGVIWCNPRSIQLIHYSGG